MHKIPLLEDYIISNFHSTDLDFKNIIENFKLNLKQAETEHDSNIHIVTLNMEHLVYAEKHQNFKTLLKKADILIPDGESICLLSKVLAGENLKKLAGIDLAEALIKSYSRIAFLGAEEAVINKLQDLLESKYNSKHFIFKHGFYSKDKETEIIKEIAEFNPELLLVALGSPRQEFLITEYRDLFSETVMVGVGGSFDIFTGKLKRAPELFIKLKLEWLFRIFQEPKRLSGFLKNLFSFCFLILKKFSHS